YAHESPARRRTTASSVNHGWGVSVIGRGIPTLKRRARQPGFAKHPAGRNATRARRTSAPKIQFTPRDNVLGGGLIHRIEPKITRITAWLQRPSLPPRNGQRKTIAPRATAPRLIPS